MAPNFNHSLSGVSRQYADWVCEFIPDTNASILVCAGGANDRRVFDCLPYRNVFISGMDMREEVHGRITPTFENAEELSFDDNEFDYAVMHAAIHHTRLPHKVLTELYRVSKKGFLAIESRDSFLMRAAERLGLTERYEVAGNFAGHGVNGTDVPNFIYRWTEREIEKTMMTYAPHVNHTFDYRYASHYPEGHGFRSGMNIIVKLLKPAYHIFTALFPKQQNHFAFFVHKARIPHDLKPWLAIDRSSGEIIVDRDWIRTKYTKRLSR